MVIAVCDDEPVCAENLASIIRRQQPECRLKAYASGEELLSDKEPFDLLFLDIRMDGTDGLNTARELRKRGSQAVIVFVTALKEYVFEAFDVAAMHYLVKPVQEEKLREVLLRAAAEINGRAEKKKEAARVLSFKAGKRHVTLPAEEIVYLESSVRKLLVHTRTETLAFYGVMDEAEKQLGYGFYRCHRAYLVNLAYVAEYTADTVKLANGEQVYLSKGKHPGFVKCYMRYLRSGGTV